MKNIEIEQKHVDRILKAMGKNGDEKVAFSIDEVNGVIAEYTNESDLDKVFDFGWLKSETNVPSDFFKKNGGMGQNIQYVTEIGETVVVNRLGMTVEVYYDDQLSSKYGIYKLSLFLYGFLNFDWERFEDLEAELKDGETLDLQTIVGLMY